MADQTQSRFFDSTIYRRPGHGQSTVGITFKPTPSLSKEDLRQLVHDLIAVYDDALGENMDFAS